MIVKLFKLSLKEVLLLFPALFYLIIAKLAIKLLPFNFLQKKFQSLTSQPIHNISNEDELQLKALSINRVAYALPFLGFSCLPKALAFKFWLKQYIGLKVNFGVQKNENNQLIAHAWVSKGDKIILGEDPTIHYKSIWIWE
jgi:hypothetical protein